MLENPNSRDGGSACPLLSAPLEGPVAGVGIPRGVASPRASFSLVEVVLAVGVFSFAVLALFGLLGPVLNSVSEFVEDGQSTALMGKIDAFLQEHEFDEVYRWVSEGRRKTLLAYTYQPDPNGDEVFDVVRETTFGGLDAEVASSRGGLFKVILSAGGVYGPGQSGGDAPGLPLPAEVVSYREGYLALEVQVYALPPPDPNDVLDRGADVSDLELALVYPTAVNR